MPKSTLRPTGGAILDIDSLEIGPQFLSRAHNVNTRKGFPSRVGGRRVAYAVDSGALPIVPFHHLNLFLNTFQWWMLFGADSIYGVEGGNFYDISMPGQVAIADPVEWSSTLLNGIPVFTNGKNEPHYWDGQGANPAVILPDWTVGKTAKIVVAFRFHLFAMNIDESAGVFDNKLIWSEATEPGAIPQSWTPSPSNEAGSAILADTPGGIMAGLPLGSQLMVYKPQSVYPVEYQGQQPDNIFAIGSPNRSIGALGPHAVAMFNKLGDRHIVLGNDDVVLFDGVNATSVAENRVKRTIANGIDETYASNSFIVHDMNQKEVWVCIPEAGSQFATIAHIWDIARDTWTTRDLNNVRYGTTGYVRDEVESSTWDSDSDTWDSDISAWNAGKTGSIQRVTLTEDDLMYVEDTTDPVDIVATITKEDMDFGDSTLRKTSRRVKLEGSGEGFLGLQFRLGARNSTSPSDGIAWGAFVNYDDPDGVPFEVDGRFISIEVRSMGPALWTVTRIILEAVASGDY